MMRRPLRILVLLLTVAVTAGVVWRATLNEQQRGRVRMASQQTDAAAADAIFELADLQASLYAYVAPGQSEAFWSARAAAQIKDIRQRLDQLAPAAEAANHPLAAAFDHMKALVAEERRALSAVREAQPLVAGDVIFAEARKAIEGVSRELSDARQAMARTASTREAGAANEQSLLAGALIGAWIFALILLTPVAERQPATSLPHAPETDAPMPASSEALGLGLNSAEPAPAAPVAPAAPAAPAVDLPSLASLCADIARVSQAGDLDPLLARAAVLLGARGVVVWLTVADGRHLAPALAFGYDEALLNRMGTIAVDDPNLTAEAFRTEAPTSAAAGPEAPGAVAVPVVSASGVSGVLAAELDAEADLERAIALAGVIAAQFANLFPAPASVSDEPSQQVHAN